MRYATLLLMFVPPVLILACSDAAKGGFEAAAEEDRRQNQAEAVDLYLEANKAAPDSRFGKLALARAEVLLLELGAQQLSADQWDELDGTGARLLALDGASGSGSVFKGYAAHGKGQLEEAERWLKKASGDIKGVAPPSEAAIEATAEALFNGASAGASSALSGSLVDTSFLGNKRDRLLKLIERDREAAARRAELVKAGTMDAMATLLTNYAKSSEAAKVRGPYAQKLAAKLASPEKVGPPTPDDPDPIATIVDSLKMRAPEEPAAVKAFARELRPAWEERYEDEIETVDKQVAAVQEGAMSKIAVIIRDKCAPLRTKLEKGDRSAAEPLKAAAIEAAELIPHGMTEEDLQKIQLFIIANCTSSKAR